MDQSSATVLMKANGKPSGVPVSRSPFLAQRDQFAAEFVVNWLVASIVADHFTQLVHTDRLALNLPAGHEFVPGGFEGGLALVGATQQFRAEPRECSGIVSFRLASRDGRRTRLRDVLGRFLRN